MASATTTTDHKVIRRWIEDRKGVPAAVRDTSIIRACFNPKRLSGNELRQITWDEFFAAFDEGGLAFLHQDEKNSRFFKFVKRSHPRAKVAA